MDEQAVTKAVSVLNKRTLRKQRANRSENNPISSFLFLKSTFCYTSKKSLF